MSYFAPVVSISFLYCITFIYIIYTQTATFIIKARIDNVRTRKGWNFPSCGGDKCRKGVTRKGGRFWYDSCNSPVEYPVIR